MNGRSHYDVLDVSPAATGSEIREAYRRLAREFHPDRTVGSAAGGERMPLINEAYRVLSDPGRRAVYDAERRNAPRPEAAPNRPAGTEYSEQPDYRFQYPEGPARIPWRSLLFFSGIAIAIIVILAQFTKPAGPPAPDNILRIGECVELLREGTAASEVVCSGDGDIVVRTVTPRNAKCPDGSPSIADRQGMVGVCLEDLDAAL